MSVQDLLGEKWAIDRRKLDVMMDVYNAHQKGIKHDYPQFESRFSIYEEYAEDEDVYPNINGNALINVEGVLSKKANLFTSFSGGTSMQMLKSHIDVALQDPNVNRIVLLVDSPGGTVDGTETLSNYIYNSRGQKEIIAFADGFMASGALWIGTSASKVYVADRTTMVGSLGVIQVVTDRSQQNEDMGVKVKEIFAGKYKTAGSPNKPLSKDDEAYIQAEVDYVYRIFAETVARNRGATVEDVLENMADGKIFLGQEAVEVGLADKIVTLDELLIESATQAEVNSMATNKPALTASDVKENHPKIAEELLAEGAASVDLDKVRIDAENAERARISGVLDQHLPGHDALIQKLAFDGETTPEQAAVQILKAEREASKEHSSRLNSDVDDLPNIPDSGASVESDANLTDDQKWKKDAKLRAEFNDDFDSFKAFSTAEKAGRIKVLSRSK